MRFVAVLMLLVVMLAGCRHEIPAYQSPFTESAPPGDDADVSPLGPQAKALQAEITSALTASEWPVLDPPIDEVLASGRLIRFSEAACTDDVVEPDPRLCVSGSDAAPTKIVLVGDSVGLGYAGPLRDIAEQSSGKIQFHNLAMAGCSFSDALIERDAMHPSCTARKQYAVDLINEIKPAAVIVSNWYSRSRIVGANDDLSPAAWASSLRTIIERFQPSTGTVALLAAPAGDANIKECLSKRSSTPSECIGSIPRYWSETANVERELADSIGAVWIDSRPWFCSAGHCPAFAGNTLIKGDGTHMAPPYGQKIVPVIDEALRESLVY